MDWARAQLVELVGPVAKPDSKTSCCVNRSDHSMSSQALHTSGYKFEERLDLGMSTKDFVWYVMLRRPSANRSPTAHLPRNKPIRAMCCRLNCAPLK